MLLICTTITNNINNYNIYNDINNDRLFALFVLLNPHHFKISKSHTQRHSFYSSCHTISLPHPPSFAQPFPHPRPHQQSTFTSTTRCATQLFTRHINCHLNPPSFVISFVALSLFIFFFLSFLFSRSSVLPFFLRALLVLPPSLSLLYFLRHRSFLHICRSNLTKPLLIDFLAFSRFCSLSFFSSFPLFPYTTHAVLW